MIRDYDKPQAIRLSGWYHFLTQEGRVVDHEARETHMCACSRARGAHFRAFPDSSDPSHADAQAGARSAPAAPAERWLHHSSGRPARLRAAAAAGARPTPRLIVIRSGSFTAALRAVRKCWPRRKTFPSRPRPNSRQERGGGARHRGWPSATAACHHGRRDRPDQKEKDFTQQAASVSGARPRESGGNPGRHFNKAARRRVALENESEIPHDTNAAANMVFGQVVGTFVDGRWSIGLRLRGRGARTRPAAKSKSRSDRRACAGARCRGRPAAGPAPSVLAPGAGVPAPVGSRSGRSSLGHGKSRKDSGDGGSAI